MKKLACNYSVVRFLPYPETDEFVNVGVLACCPEIGWMDCILELRKTKRIGDFFPELDIGMYTAGRKHFNAEMCRLTGDLHVIRPGQLALPMEQEHVASVFSEFIRPREELFRFGPPGTMLTDDPENDLRVLFHHYVDRHFAKRKDYQEKEMTERLTATFRKKNLLERYHKARLGDDTYGVTIPFVATQQDDPRPIRALKPLNLNQAEATAIREHGDAWHARLSRLSKMHVMPRNMLFAVKYPPRNQDRRYTAAQEIEALLTETRGVVVENFENRKALIQFAETE
jgi:hypothetical protein